MYIAGIGFSSCLYAGNMYIIQENPFTCPEGVQEEWSLVPLLFSLGHIYSGQIHAAAAFPTGKIPITF